MRRRAVYLAGLHILSFAPGVDDTIDGAVTLVSYAHLPVSIAHALLAGAAPDGGFAVITTCPSPTSLIYVLGWDVRWCLALHDPKLWATLGSYVLRPPQSN